MVDRVFQLSAEQYAIWIKFWELFRIRGINDNRFQEAPDIMLAIVNRGLRNHASPANIMSALMVVGRLDPMGKWFWEALLQKLERDRETNNYRRGLLKEIHDDSYGQMIGLVQGHISSMK